MIDPEAERERLNKQKQEIEKALKPIESKLNNKNFIKKAAPEVVERSKIRHQELVNQLEAVEKHINELE